MGAWAGAFASRDSHEVTFGGLAGANLGALAGYRSCGTHPKNHFERTSMHTDAIRRRLKGA
jgi:hypothetical protein